MKRYYVKLSEESRKNNQHRDGYLYCPWQQDIAVYSQGEAIKKARMFGGKIEPCDIWKNKAYAEYERVRRLKAFNIQHALVKRRLNQHATHYRFSDESTLIISDTSQKITCYNKEGAAQAECALFCN